MRSEVHLFTALFALFAFSAFADGPGGRARGLPKKSISAEQILSGKVPFFSNIRNPLGLLKPMVSNNGDLPRFYWPTEENEFQLPCVLIPEKELSVKVIDEAITPAELKTLRVVNSAGEVSYRFFIHPTQTGHYRSLIAKYPADPVKWYATPSSSARSLFVYDVEGRFDPFVVKTSLNLAMGGMPSRLVETQHLQRGVRITPLVEDLYKKTGGKLADSGMTWDFFRESASFGPPEIEKGGYIFRSLPQNYTETIQIPWYALVAKRDGSNRWIDELYEASGYASKADFVFDKLAKPLVEIFSILAYQGGLTSEFHQQNTVVVIDPATKKITGISFRDMDAIWVDESLRVNELGFPPLGRMAFEEEAKLFKFFGTTQRMIKEYAEAVRYHSLKSILKYFLRRKDLKKVLRRSDYYMIEKFNRAFPKYRIREPKDWANAWRKLDAAVVTAEERQVYDRLSAEDKRTPLQRRVERIYDRFMEDHLQYSDAELAAQACIRNTLSPAR